MKKLFLFLTVIAASTFIYAQTDAKKADEVIKFKEMKHDFGKIKQGVPVTYDFVFMNVGESPAIIENATASCGCTTPSWPQQPVMKGKSDKIKAGFNAAAPGVFEKGIFVKVKGYDYPVEIKITGEVLSSEAFTKYEAEKKNKSGK